MLEELRKGFLARVARLESDMLTSKMVTAKDITELERKGKHKL